MTTLTRPAQFADLQVIVNIDKALFGKESFQSYSLRQILNLFPDSVFVAEEDEELIGYAAVGVKAFSKEAWLLSMAVLADHQKRGVGTKLLTACMGYCISAEIKSCRLTTDPANGPALAFYKKVGFEIEAEHQNYYEPGDSRVVLCRSFGRA